MNDSSDVREKKTVEEKSENNKEVKSSKKIHFRKRKNIYRST